MQRESSSRTRWSWALAPVLAGLAVLLQYIIDVPKGTMLPREAGVTVGEAEAMKSKAKPKPKPKAKPKPRQPKPKARTAEQIATLRAEWSEQPFESEPVDQLFRRQHEALLRSVVTRARTEALGEREAQPMQIRPSCRTIRCALELCGDKTLVDDVAETLPRANVSGASLWHELREVEATRKIPKRESTKDHVCRRWIVGFALENPTVGKVTLDAAAP
jgi:hypothetical protein